MKKRLCLRLKKFEGMTKKLFIIAVFLTLCSHSYSQKHQISAGMGLASSNQILDVFESSLTFLFVQGSALNETGQVGEFRIAYAYIPQERWRFGGSLSFSQTDYDVIHDQLKHGEQANSYYTLAAESSYAYLKREKFNMYALVGAGATFRNSKQINFYLGEDETLSDTLFNFQITPIGASYGKQWGGFAELGFGYRGIFSFGLFYNFG